MKAEDLFARDGHLTMLSVDRFEQGELSLDQCDTVIDHLQDCPVCSARHARLHDEIVNITPPQHLFEPPSFPQRFAIGSLGIGATLALAASLLLVIWPTPQQATPADDQGSALTSSSYSTTSTTFEFEPSQEPPGGFVLEVSAPETSAEPLQSGDLVPASEPLTLELRSMRAGYILALQSAGHGFPSEGADGTGGSDPIFDLKVLASMTEVEPGQTLRIDAPAEYYRDGEQIDELFIVVMCPEAFSADLRDIDLEMAEFDGCSAQELALTRFSGGADA